MATKSKAPTREDLVTEGFLLKREIKAKQDRLKEIEAELITHHGAGTHTGREGAECAVVVPNPGIKVVEGDIERCQDIAGEHFSKLFDKIVSHVPVKAFREVAAALLTKAKAAKLIAVLEKTSSPFVKWAK